MPVASPLNRQDESKGAHYLPVQAKGSECTGGLNTHCTRIKDTEGIRIYPHDLSETIC